MIKVSPYYSLVSKDEVQLGLKKQADIKLPYINKLRKSNFNASPTNRPVYQKLLFLIRNKKIDFIVCKEI